MNAAWRAVAALALWSDCFVAGPAEQLDLARLVASAKGGEAHLSACEVYELRSVWR